MLLTGDVCAERQLFAVVIERVEAAANYGGTLRQIDENAQMLLLSGRATDLVLVLLCLLTGLELVAAEGPGLRLCLSDRL